MRRPEPGRAGLRGAPLRALVVGAGLGLFALAAQADDQAVQRQLERLAARLQQLEQRNQELERRLEELSGARAGAPAGTWGAAREERIDRLEQGNRTLQQRVDDLARGNELAEAAEGGGPTVEASLVTVAQQVNAAGSADGTRQRRLNYRGDLSIALPGGSIGDAQGSAFAQLRFGQGTGTALRPTYTSSVNSVGFETAAGPDDSLGVVAQAWYQLEWALKGGGFNEQRGDRVELTLGKMDVFGFFDQNAAAGDEAAQFLNNAFVHNPLLDSGGDIAADAYGFAPGARVAYFNTGDGSLSWGASLGAFASGNGANFSGGLGRPLTIAQFEISPMQINGEPRGSYRLYAWTNGRTTGLDGNAQRHTGVGVSLDQRVGRDWNLFARAGRRLRGDAGFDRALTLGFEHGGRAWGRGHDAVGLAVGLLRTDNAWRDATADGSRVGYTAARNERLLELYYRLHVNEHIEISPDFQLIQRPGGDGSASGLKVYGLRAALGF